VDTPQFNVTTAKTTYKAGENVVFNLSGTAEIMSFFSGEPLLEYEHKNNRIIAPEFINVSFSTGVAYGTHPDLLSVWVSNDFNGKYTMDDVLAATWSNDITKNFKLAPNSMNSTSSALSVPSGILDIKSAAIDKTKPVYLAFKYYKTPDSIGGTQRNWFVRSLKIETGTILGSQVFSDSRGLILVYDEHFTSEALKNTTLTSSTMTIRVPNAINLDTVQVWAISPPLSAADFENGPDRPIPIRGYRDEPIKTYEYVFKTPGTYKAVFVAKNSNIYGESEEIVRTIPITITE
jgi:hypothetical protein